MVIVFARWLKEDATVIFFGRCLTECYRIASIHRILITVISSLIFFFSPSRWHILYPLPQLLFLVLIYSFEQFITMFTSHSSVCFNNNHILISVATLTLYCTFVLDKLAIGMSENIDLSLTVRLLIFYLLDRMPNCWQVHSARCSSRLLLFSCTQFIFMNVRCYYLNRPTYLVGCNMGTVTPERGKIL